MDELVDFGHPEEADPTKFLDEPVKTVVAFRDQLTPQHLLALAAIVDLFPDQSLPEVYSSRFDLAEELNQQVAMTQAMRKHVMTGSRIKADITLREVKEATTAANTMIATLMKHHREVVNMTRICAIERATIAVMQEEGLGGEFKEKLRSELEAVDMKL